MSELQTLGGIPNEILSNKLPLEPPGDVASKTNTVEVCPGGIRYMPE